MRPLVDQLSDLRNCLNGNGGSDDYDDNNSDGGDYCQESEKDYHPLENSDLPIPPQFIQGISVDKGENRDGISTKFPLIVKQAKTQQTKKYRIFEEVGLPTIDEKERLLNILAAAQNSKPIPHQTGGGGGRITV